MSKTRNAENDANTTNYAKLQKIVLEDYQKFIWTARNSNLPK